MGQLHEGLHATGEHLHRGRDHAHHGVVLLLLSSTGSSILGTAKLRRSEIGSCDSCRSRQGGTERRRKLSEAVAAATAAARLKLLWDADEIAGNLRGP